jgi:tetratricopeptide (TPR) repeat protein
MSRSKLLPVLAAVGTVAGMLSLSVATAMAAQQQTVSAALAKPLMAARDAIEAKKYSEAIAKLQEVQATAGRSPYDEYVVNEMLGIAYAQTSRYAEAAKALEAALDSGFLTQSKVPEWVHSLISLHYRVQDYQKVIELGTRAVKAGYADDNIYTWVGQAYFERGDYGDAAKFLRSYVDGQIKAGKKPKETTLVLIDNACEKAGEKPGDPDCAEHVLEQLIEYYPKREYWQAALNNFLRRETAETEAIVLHVYRLAAAVDALKIAHDYSEFAHLAIDAGSPGEAQSILEKGIRDNVFADRRSLDTNTRLLETARKQAAADKVLLPKTAAEAAAAPLGTKDVSVGLAYLGYGQYDKAVEAIKRGLSKPGVRNTADAQLLLGIAELSAGQKEQARKTFGTVKGDPDLQRLAKLWSLYAQA